MADQLSAGMGNLGLDSPSAGQLGGQQAPLRSYIPPHMRGKMGGPVPPQGGPPMGGPGGPPPNGGGGGRGGNGGGGNGDDGN